MKPSLFYGSMQRRTYYGHPKDEGMLRCQYATVTLSRQRSGEA